MTTEGSTISELYLACRNNDINKVEELIRTLSLDEIDRIEANGSTALHVASYYGHIDVVRLLLERGASHSIKNAFGHTPQAESRTDAIKHLFLRKNETDRYVCHSEKIEWMKFDESVHRQAERWRWLIKHSWEGRSFDCLVHEIQNDFINNDFQESKDFELIKHFFNQAANKMDPMYLIKAYTAETDFYKDLNKQLAIIGGNFKSKTNNVNCCGMKCYLQVLFTHHDFDRLSYTGKCYRGMLVSKDDLEQYKVGTQIMNKAFLSTSSDYDVAKGFALKDADKNKEKHTVLCTYKIQTIRTALNIMEMSEYPDEKEILIMPYTAFRVKSIQTNSTNENDQPQFLIDLEEYGATNGQVNRTEAINTEKPVTFRKKITERFNKWLRNET